MVGVRVIDQRLGRILVFEHMEGDALGRQSERTRPLLQRDQALDVQVAALFIEIVGDGQERLAQDVDAS